MDPFADIDLDAEAIWFDGAWCTRQDLARRIKKLVDEGDYRVARPSEALERLEAVLAATQVLATRVPAELAAALAGAAKQTGHPIGRLARVGPARRCHRFVATLAPGPQAHDRQGARDHHQAQRQPASMCVVHRAP